MLIRLIKEISLFMVFLIAVLPITATAAIYTIDPAQSFVYYAPWYMIPPCNADFFPTFTGACETHALSGTFRFGSTDYEGPNLPGIYLSAIDIQPSSLPPGPLTFNSTYYGGFGESHFYGTENPCSSWFGPGTCYSQGNFGYVEGTLNDGNLYMEGALGIDSLSSYFFTIRATMTVPDATTSTTTIPPTTTTTYVTTISSTTSVPGQTSVRSVNAVISDVTVTDSIPGAPPNYTPETVVSFKATGVASIANVGINYSLLPTNPVFYKVVNGAWKQIYPTNQSNGITNIALIGNTLSFTITDNSACDGDPAVGTISDPVVTGSEGPGRGHLYFPHIDTGLPWQTEIAVINTGDQTVTGTLMALSDDGQLIESKTVALSAHGRRQISISGEFTNHTDIGYIIFDTDSATVQGYVKFYQEGIFRVAIPAVNEVNTSDIYISHIDSGARWRTGVSLLNTTSATKNLTITFNNGQSRDITLNANQHTAFMIESLFNNQPQPDIQSAVITNASGVIGLEFFGSNGEANQLDGLLLTGKTASTLYYPHVANDGWWTGIVAYNPSASACTMTITPCNAQGLPLAPVVRSLEGKGKYVGVISGLGLPAQTAWFKIDSTQPLTGFELFGTTDSKQLAAYSGVVGAGSKAGVFPKREKSGWTGIVFVNTEAGAASVTLTAYNDNGAVVATRMLPIGGYAKEINLAEAFFTQDISGATYIAYSSDRNVVGFQLNGTSDGMMLDGLPALGETN